MDPHGAVPFPAITGHAQRAVDRHPPQDGLETADPAAVAQTSQAARPAAAAATAKAASNEAATTANGGASTATTATTATPSASSAPAASREAAPATVRGRAFGRSAGETGARAAVAPHMAPRRPSRAPAAIPSSSRARPSAPALCETPRPPPARRGSGGAHLSGRQRVRSRLQHRTRRPRGDDAPPSGSAAAAALPLPRQGEETRFSRIRPRNRRGTFALQLGPQTSHPTCYTSPMPC